MNLQVDWKHLEELGLKLGFQEGLELVQPSWAGARAMG